MGGGGGGGGGGKRVDGVEEEDGDTEGCDVLEGMLKI